MSARIVSPNERRGIAVAPVIRYWPGFHSADQKAGEFSISGPNKQTHDSFELFVILEHEKNRLFRIEHPTCPDRENGCAADVERACDVTAAKREHVAHVDKDTSLCFDRFLKSSGRKGCNPWKISEYFRPVRGHFFHDRIVMRFWGRDFNPILGDHLPNIEFE